MFIGMNAIVLRNVIIGDDVVIGAGAVVTKDCPSGGVYAGNPAHRVADIGSFYEKRLSCQLAEAKDLARAYEERYGKRPGPEIFHEYFMLFSNNPDSLSCETFMSQMHLCGNGDASTDYIRSVRPPFLNFDQFERYCFDE